VLVRRLPLRSLRLGLAGVADVVEFHRLPHEGGEDDAEGRGIRLSGFGGRWVPFPIEYKRGRPKPHRADEAQVCAQGLCLEEMLGIQVSCGALFYGQEKRRVPVCFDSELRALTARAALRLQELAASAITPPAVKTRACKSCSLVALCLPQVTGGRSAQVYLRSAVQNLAKEPEKTP
jgi:CRISPR-associated exonuclease Cas4